MAREKAEQLNGKRIQQAQKNAELNSISISVFEKLLHSTHPHFSKELKQIMVLGDDILDTKQLIP